MPVHKKMGEFFAHLFLPRRSNNQRPRILHPAGLSVLVAVFLVAHSLQSLLGHLPGLVLGFASSITIDEVIAKTNEERAKSGLPALTQNPALTQAAFAKASDMFARNYWAHVSPTGTQPWAFIKNAGYSYRSAGENLARDFADTPNLIQAWMASPTHKENILSGNYHDIGVAVVDGILLGTETRLVVQMFGSPVAVPLAQKPKQTAPSVLSAPVQETEKAAPVEIQPETVPETPLAETKASLEEISYFRNTKPQPFAPKYAGTSIIEGFLQTERTERLISPTKVTQVFGLMLVALVLGTLVVDWVISHRRRTIRLVGKNWAHLMFLGAVGLMMMQFVGGKIL